MHQVQTRGTIRSLKTSTSNQRDKQEKHTKIEKPRAVIFDDKREVAKGTGKRHTQKIKKILPAHLLAESTVYALRHVNVIHRGTARTVVAFFLKHVIPGRWGIRRLSFRLAMRCAATLYTLLRKGDGGLPLRCRLLVLGKWPRTTCRQCTYRMRKDEAN